MRLSAKTTYGLRILLQICLDNREGIISPGKSISKRQEIPEPYLEQIMITLRNAGVVKTVRGCNGGYFLNKPAGEITVLDVIELFEGEFNLIDEVSVRRPCLRIIDRRANYVWVEIAKSLRDVAEKITLASILDKEPEPILDKVQQ